MTMCGRAAMRRQASSASRRFSAIASRKAAAPKIKELRIYENQFHGIARFNDDIYMTSADWLRDILDDRVPKKKKRIVLVDAARMEHDVDEKSLAGGFSYIRKDSE